MLRDGKFIKEDPPKIGAYYIPKLVQDNYTPEERFAQSLLLGYKETQFSLFSRVLGFVLRV